MRSLHGLWKGSQLRRRRDVRRDGDHHPAGIDWHDAHWLVPVVLVLALSVVDALMTLTLIKHGAYEVNPFMAPLLASGSGFAFWKLGLTILGVVTLTVLARVRLFGVISAGVVLYLILAGYVVLVAYEWSLLMRVGMDFVSY